MADEVQTRFRRVVQSELRRSDRRQKTSKTSPEQRLHARYQREVAHIRKSLGALRALSPVITIHESQGDTSTQWSIHVTGQLLTSFELRRTDRTVDVRWAEYPAARTADSACEVLRGSLVDLLARTVAQRRVAAKRSGQPWPEDITPRHGAVIGIQWAQRASPDELRKLARAFKDADVPAWVSARALGLAILTGDQEYEGPDIPEDVQLSESEEADYVNDLFDIEDEADDLVMKIFGLDPHGEWGPDEIPSAAIQTFLEAALPKARRAAREWRQALSAGSQERCASERRRAEDRELKNLERARRERLARAKDPKD